MGKIKECKIYQSEFMVFDSKGSIELGVRNKLIEAGFDLTKEFTVTDSLIEDCQIFRQYQEDGE